MANSIRHQIMDAVIAALNAITAGATYNSTVKYVSEAFEGYQEIDIKNLPAVFPIDTDETRSPGAIGAGGADDTESELKIVCTCMVYNPRNTTRQARTDLMRDVEKALVNDTSLAALISSIEPSEVTTDQGTIPNYSIWDQTFIITYYYNSTAGG